MAFLAAEGALAAAPEIAVGAAELGGAAVGELGVLEGFASSLTEPVLAGARSFTNVASPYIRGIAPYIGKGTSVVGKVVSNPIVAFTVGPIAVSKAHQGIGRVIMRGKKNHNKLLRGMAKGMNVLYKPTNTNIGKTALGFIGAGAMMSVKGGIKSPMVRK